MSIVPGKAEFNNVMDGLSIAVVSINIAGNILNLFIYSRKKFKTVSSTFYFICMSIVSILSTSEAIAALISTLEVEEIRLRLRLYLTKTFIFYPPWIAVLITFDFMISIRYKLQITQKILFKILLTISILAALSFCEISILYTKYTAVLLYQFGLPFELNIVELLFIPCIPFTLMLILNIIIVYTIVKSRKKTTENLKNISSFNSEFQKKKLKRERMFAINVFAINIAFFLAYSPDMLSQLVRLIVEDPKFRSQWTNYVRISLLIRQSYVATQFMIHLVTNKIYRSELIIALKDSYMLVHQYTVKKIFRK